MFIRSIFFYFQMVSYIFGNFEYPFSAKFLLISRELQSEKISSRKNAKIEQKILEASRFDRGDRFTKIF